MNLHIQAKTIKNKLGLLNLPKELVIVSRACKVFGYSRDSFYCFKKLYEEYGEEGLQEVFRKRPNLKNKIPKKMESAVIAFAIEYPAYGQIRAVIDQVIADNPENLEKYRAGNSRLMGFFVGQVLKATGGKANPKVVNQLVKEKLDSAS